MTSWALLAMYAAGEARGPAVRRGVVFLRARQQADGRWPSEHIAGVFNKSCAIHYDAYLRVFPMWALALVESPGNSMTPSG
jgi:squalene cyclase